MGFVRQFGLNQLVEQLFDIQQFQLSFRNQLLLLIIVLLLGLLRLLWLLEMLMLSTLSVQALPVLPAIRWCLVLS